MKIKLIAPHESGETLISSAETFKVQKLALPLLAALTPEGHEVKLVDEAFAPDDVNEEVDLVGITVLTDLVPRAYRLADRYRARGVRVVLGGMHPSVLPREALKHADAVVVGEGEESWPRLVEDTVAGRLKRIYRSEKMTDLKKLPRPRHDLYPVPGIKGYTPVATTVEASRGCVFRCEFCSISRVMGQGHRVRPPADVAAEIESIESPHLFFVDDSLALNRPVARKLFQEIRPLKKFWVGQGSVSLAEDTDLLRAMKESGCLGLLVGLESVQMEARDEMQKFNGLRISFKEAMQRFHGEGIGILGAFIFGFDHETGDVFDRTLEFSMKHRLEGVELRILVPFPGTPIYARLLSEKRLFAPEWWLNGYSSDMLLFKPKGMTPRELLDGFTRLNRQIYSYGSIARRILGVNPFKRRATGCRLVAGFNLATRKRYFKSLDAEQPFAGVAEGNYR